MPCMSIQAEDLSSYVPAFGWEMAPPSQKQVKALEKCGILPDQIDNAGKAALLLDKIEKRRNAEVYGGKLEDETLSTVNAIINALDSMPPETREAALNAIRPIYEELEKAEPKLTEKVSGMLNSIVGTVKRLLGIHSPSRVMRKLSKYTWQGFELETDKAEPRLIDQAKELAQGIIKGFELPQASLPFHIDTTGLDVHNIAAYLEDTVRQGRASMSSAIMARAEQQIINQLDTSAIARACREGCESADVTVEGELRAEFSADGRQLGEVVTPYVNRNMGLQRRALLRGGKA